MPRIRRRASGALAATCVLAAFAGCGGSSNQASTSSSGTPATGSEGGSGGTFVYAVPEVPESLDNSPYGGTTTKLLYTALDSRLLDYDTANLEDAGCNELGGPEAMRGVLAESWELSEDRKTLTIKLRDTASGFGNKLTAEDVKWSLERQLELSPYTTTLLGTIGSFDMDNLLTIVDDRTIEFNIKQPKSFDPMVFSSVEMTIWDSTEAKKHATEKDPWAHEWLQANTADFGPWKLERFTSGSELVMVPNEGYTGDRGNVDRLVIKEVPDSATRTQLVQTGEADYAAALNFHEYKRLQSVDTVDVKSCVTPDRTTLFLQIDKKIFADPKVRQAVSYAIDRQSIVDAIYQGFGEPSIHGLSRFFPFPAPDVQLTHDPDKARALLAEAGYPNGFDVTIMYNANRPGPHVEQVGVQVQKDLTAVNIRAKLQNVPGSAEFYDLVVNSRYEATFYSESTVISDPAFAGAAFALSTSNINSFNYSNPEYDKLITDAQLAQGDERDQLLTQAAALGVEDPPMVYLIDQRAPHAFASGVSGFESSPQGMISPGRLSKAAG